MIYQKRGSAPTNVIKLTLDYRTLDQLRDLAKARKIDMTRCAYELLQECLELSASPAIAAATIELEDRPFDFNNVAAFKRPRETQ